MTPRTATARPLAARLAAGLAGAVAAPLAAQDGRATLSVAGTGNYLVGPERKPVCRFTTGTQGTGEPPAVSCPVECRSVWPPVDVGGDITPGGDANEEMAVTVGLNDRPAVTYTGRPLYTFERDTAGEPPQGSHVESYRGARYLIGPYGACVEEMSGRAPQVAATPG